MSEDKRFFASYEVGSQHNEGLNLAAMDWEDFEHLIRQLFEQEFNQAGGEVKITQASRDGGRDAIAFDPDVIRGSKTVIQAKPLHKHRRRVCRSRPLWHCAKRTCEQRNSCDDIRLRPGFLRIRQAQTARTPERRESAEPFEETWAQGKD
jgi:hypothetical protein